MNPITFIDPATTSPLIPELDETLLTVDPSANPSKSMVLPGAAFTRPAGSAVTSTNVNALTRAARLTTPIKAI